MIKDEKQYKFTQEWVKKFSQSIAALELDENKKTTDPDGWELLRASLQSQLDTLTEEIAEYETLTSHDVRTPIVLKLNEISYLPQLLIKARLAAKLTQKELADLAGLTEEQIREYEDKDYERASFLDFMAVMDALALKIQKGEFLVPLDTFRRTPITQEELLSKKENQSSQSYQFYLAPARRPSAQR